MGSDTCSSIITASPLGAGIEIREGIREPTPPRKPSGILYTYICPNPLCQRAGIAGLAAGGSKHFSPVGTFTISIMQIRVVTSRAEIATVDPDERVFHLTFTPTTVALLDLMQRCPRLEAIQVPPFQFRNMFKSSRCFLEARGVTIFEGTIQGYRSATGDHYTVDEGSILQRAGELRAEGLDSGEIVA
ncbi:MAG: DUF1699 family protein, partial [Methanothrix sp.]